MSYLKRLIEVDLPIARISAHARREKSIRHGHISTLHIWWARRPLAACRAVICAALWPDPADPLCPPAFRTAAVEALTAFARRVNPERITKEKRQLQETLSEESRGRWEALAAGTLTMNPDEATDMHVLRMALLDFIADFANWDNSTVPAYLETSRALTQFAHESLGGIPGTRPLVVDPFAGGGSIPLEALRVGADAFASDLNPVPVLLNKVVLEYIPKYGQRLAEEVRKWSAWIKAEAEKELAEFYPQDADGATPSAYLWARTILSEAPGESDAPIEIPLMRSTWLAKRKGESCCLRWQRDDEGKIRLKTVEVKLVDGTTQHIRRIQTEIVESSTDNLSEPPTSRGGAATCPVSGYTTSVESVRQQLSARSGGAADARLMTVVLTRESANGKSYRTSIPTDYQSVAAASARLNDLASVKRAPNDLPLLPDGELNHLRGFFNVILYGMTKWKLLFSPRQNLLLATISHLIEKAGQEIGNKCDPLMREAVQTCLAMVLGRMVDYSSSLCMWAASGEFVCHTFGRQALPMVWDFAEVNPFADTGWNGASEWVLRVLDEVTDSRSEVGTVERASATNHPLPDCSADAVVTDPPYYAAIPYADLSDFFCSWLARSVGTIHTQLFAHELASKEEECVSLAHRAAMYRHKDGAWFEAMMQKACAEARRVNKVEGVGVFVFANKETAGWEAMLSALISSGWVVTASWPIDTERAGRLRARNSAALASSVHLVCRPREDASGAVTESVGEWRDVLGELPKRIHEWMPRLAAEGVVGADAIFACLGPALEIFSRYSRVEKANGETATLREYLEHVWAAVSTEALSLIFKDANAAGLEPDARLTAMWLWTIGGGANNNGKKSSNEDVDEAIEEEASDDDESTVAEKTKVAGGFLLEYDAARKIAQGLGIHLEQSESLVEIKGDRARLLPVAERTTYLFGKGATATTAGAGRKKKVKQKSLFEELDEVEAVEGGWIDLKGPPPGTTVLDRVHQAMILFAGNRGELLKRFLVEDGVGKDDRFWKLADNLNKLYPPGTEERRWVEGLLARKKGLGL
jgi:putative DNA methylase